MLTYNIFEKSPENYRKINNDNIFLLDIHRGISSRLCLIKECSGKSLAAGFETRSYERRFVKIL
jgi:hypothetical protein